MNELIKSEAEKFARHIQGEDYSDVSSNVNFELMKQAFAAGFNRCLELSKQDNEDSFQDWLKSLLTNEDKEYLKEKNTPSPYWTPTYENGKPAARDSWCAAAKLKDVEIMELNNRIMSLKFNLNCEYRNIEKIEKKLKVVVEALNESYEMIRSTSYTVDNNTGNRVMDGNEYVWIDRGIIVMKEALEKI
jgi:hypothetical protein